MKNDSGFISLAGPNKVRVSKDGVKLFNAFWRGSPSTLRATRAYEFEFSDGGILIDYDVPEHDDGPAVANLAEDCCAWLRDDILPCWL